MPVLIHDLVTDKKTGVTLSHYRLIEPLRYPLLGTNKEKALLELKERNIPIPAEMEITDKEWKVQVDDNAVYNTDGLWSNDGTAHVEAVINIHTWLKKSATALAEQDQPEKFITDELAKCFAIHGANYSEIAKYLIGLAQKAGCARTSAMPTKANSTVSKPLNKPKRGNPVRRQSPTLMGPDQPKSTSEALHQQPMLGI